MNSSHRSEWEDKYKEGHVDNSTHRFECEVTLEDRLSDLCENGALGVSQVHPPDACVNHTALVLILGLLRLRKTKQSVRMWNQH